MKPFPWRSLIKWTAYWLIVVAVSATNENGWMFLTGLWIYLLMTLPKSNAESERTARVMNILKSIDNRLEIIALQTRPKP